MPLEEMMFTRFLPPALLLAAACLAAQAQERPASEVDGLYSDLSSLTDVAGRCEEDLKNFAKRALEESPSCRQFAQRFGERFTDRSALLAEVSQVTDRSARGELACDRPCQEMLKKCEEMRIGLTYLLDYMDFVKEF
jgi:hypothetical protein